MSQTETSSQAAHLTINELAEARAEHRLERALEEFTQASQFQVAFASLSRHQWGTKKPRRMKAMNQTEAIQDTAVQEFDEAAEARSQLRMEEALETFAEASKAAISNPICPRCISPNGQWRGYRTRARSGEVIHRRRCNTCTKWYGKGHW